MSDKTEWMLLSDRMEQLTTKIGGVEFVNDYAFW